MKEAAVFVCGIMFGITVVIAWPAEGKTFDERKFERLAKHREIRRANERRYEACILECMSTCK